MNICIVDHGRKIPAENYGGTERVIWGLGKSLVEMGHRVTFLVPEGSTCGFAEVLILKKDVDLNEQIPAHIDFVHLNLFPLQPMLKPYLITVHGNVPEKGPLDRNVVFVSKNQAERYNSETYVYNGLNWEDYPSPNIGINRNGFHFLGKADWKVKNLMGAIKIALKNKDEIKVIGGERWTYANVKRGFKYLLNPKVHFHGMLGDKDKTKLMETSKGLLFPVKWHEPFGLAIIESLYAGCAIFGTKNGSLPELVTAETGFLGNSTDEIACGIKNFKYNPALCHQYAVDNFNSARMAADYYKLYEKVLNGESLNKNPIYIPEKNRVPVFK